MIKSILSISGLLAAALFLQSTPLYHYLGIYSVVPDLALLLLVFFSIQKGSMVGQFAGFLAGLVLAMLGSGYPAGVFSIAYLLLGYVFGFGKGNIFFDPVLIPLLVGIVATVLRNGIIFLLNWIFQLGRPPEDIFGMALLIETAYNALLAIPLFALVTFIRNRLTSGRRGFHG